MHLNSYIVSKDPKKTLGEIIEYIKQGVDPQRNLINSWEVCLDTRIIEDGNYNEPYTVLLINKENNSDEKTCLSLHAYVGSDDECQIGQRFIVCTPHFWTTYIEKHHSYFNSELEDFLKDFDQFIQTHFYTLYEEYTIV